MTLPATENFTDSDYTLLENHGSNWSLGTAGLAIVSNTCYPYAVGSPVCYWSADVFNADQYSEFTITAISAYHGVGVAVHVQNAAGSNYYCFYGETNQSQIAKCVSGTLTTLSASPTAALAASDVIKLEATVSGGTTTLKAYINGGLVDTVTDTTYTSGSAGVMGQDDSGGNSSFDNWTGDNIAAGGGNIILVNFNGGMRDLNGGMRG